MTSGLSENEELEVRRLRFDTQIEDEYRTEVSLAARNRLRLVLTVAYVVVAAYATMLLAPRAGRSQSSLETFLIIYFGLPLLPVAATFIPRVERAVTSITAGGWLFGQGLAILALIRNANNLQRPTEVALAIIVEGICAVVLVRMPAYVVAFSGYCLFAIFVWKCRAVGVPLERSGTAFDMVLPIGSVWLFSAVTCLTLGAYFSETLDRRSFLLRRKLAEERARSESLIANMLPAPIAAQLKAQQDVIAEVHEDVTVMFLDLVNFTPYSASHGAREVVSLLNQVFSSFDALVEKYNLEKIKTIGDAYMVAGGLPDYREDHLEACLQLGFEMLRSLDELGLQARVGLHSGRVVAGVIGTKRYLYDLWGDTVNIASRMESQGLPGEIQIAAAVAERLTDAYLVQERGTIDLKGLGPTKTFTVRERQPALAEESLTPELA